MVEDLLGRRGLEDVEWPLTVTVLNQRVVELQVVDVWLVELLLNALAVLCERIVPQENDCLLEEVGRFSQENLAELVVP